MVMRVGVVIAIVLWGAAAAAQEAAPENAEEPWFAQRAHLVGPRQVSLGDSIELALPADFVLLEREEARRTLREQGDSDGDVLAIVVKAGSPWSVVLSYDDVGHVSDEDAADLAPGPLLAAMREGTLQQNETRKKLGQPELFLDGWLEEPRYDRARRQLLWGIRGHAASGPLINAFTRLLGRRGVISVNLIAAPDDLAAARLETAVLLEATTFQPGARYEDFREGDKSSGLGLKALVLGGAGLAVAKGAKAGILVTLLLALKKGFVVVALAIGGAVKWLLGRKKPSPPPDPDPAG